MKKSQYLSKLKVRLIKNGLKKAEIDGALQYYGELIDEAVDSGEKEDEVVSRLPSPQAAADEIKGVNDIPDEPKISSPRATKVETQRIAQSNTAQSNNQNKDRTNNDKNIIIRIVGLVLFIIFVLPLSIAFASVVISLVAAGVSVIVSMLAVGIALPVYAVFAATLSHSALLLFTYLGAGLICLALGLFAARAFKPLIKFVVWFFKLLFKSLINLTKGTVSYGR